MTFDKSPGRGNPPDTEKEVNVQMDASMILSIIGIALACYSLGYSVRGLVESSGKRNNQRSDTDKNGNC